jgi:hypothetical protein
VEDELGRMNISDRNIVPETVAPAESVVTPMMRQYQEI